MTRVKTHFPKERERQFSDNVPAEFLLILVLIISSIMRPSRLTPLLAVLSPHPDLGRSSLLPHSHHREAAKHHEVRGGFSIEKIVKLS